MDSDAQGIRKHVNDSVPGARQTVAIWSMQESDATTKTSDKIQVEILVRLHELEEFIAERLGGLYANEMGMTISMFLHRLIPEGRQFAQGFVLEGQPSNGNASCARIVELLSLHGFPFASNVAMGDRLLSNQPLDPKLVDPMKWEVRRVLFAVANRPDADPSMLLRDATVRLESGLKEKFKSIARFSRSLDVESEVKARLHAFSQFAERVEGDAEFLEDARRHLARSA